LNTTENLNSDMSDIYLNICQNDDMGRLDKALMMDFSLANGETFLRIETVDLEPRECLCTDWTIEMYGAIIKHDGSPVEWAGNIYWNLYKVPDYYALGLINVLMRAREWNCIEAWSEIFEKWEKGDAISGRDLELDEDVEGIVVNPAQFEILFKVPQWTDKVHWRRMQFIRKRRMELLERAK
jgi:hypothetical protein